MKIPINGVVYLLSAVINLPYIQSKVPDVDFDTEFVEVMSEIRDRFPAALALQPYKAVGDFRSTFVLVPTEIDNPIGEGVYTREAVIAFAQEFEDYLPYANFDTIEQAINSYMPENTTIH